MQKSPGYVINESKNGKEYGNNFDQESETFYKEYKKKSIIPFKYGYRMSIMYFWQVLSDLEAKDQGNKLTNGNKNLLNSYS